LDGTCTSKETGTACIYSISNDIVVISNSVVANYYIHFLDGVICHYIIQKLEKESALALGTIHDCFFIKFSSGGFKKLYKQGLLLALIVHQYNLFIGFMI